MAGRGARDVVVGKATRGAARGAGKAARGVGRAALKSGAARGVGKAALKGGKAGARRAASGSGETPGARYLKYGLFAIAGFAIGAFLSRSGEKEVGTPSFTGGAAGGPDLGGRGETWGSGTFVGSANVGAEGGTSPQDRSPAGPGRSAQPEAARQDQTVAEPPYQQPEEENRAGVDRDYSDPSSGPLIGRRHDDPARPPEMPVQHEEVENRIRTRVGEDPRTLNVPHINVEVNDEVAEIRGNAPSEEARQAVTEIARETEGVGEVRNLMTVDLQDQTEGGQTPGTAAPDRP